MPFNSNIYIGIIPETEKILILKFEEVNQPEADNFLSPSYKITSCILVYKDLLTPYVESLPISSCRATSYLLM